MKTLYKKTGTDEIINQQIIKEAAEIIKKGGLVAFPTETVYGLGANALDENAAKKIYEAKGRPSDNPLIVHIGSIAMLNEIARDISPTARLLADIFWPGPLTLVLKKKSIIPDATSGGLDTVAVRIPENNTALKLINMSGVPIAGPSANSSTKPSPTRAEHVLEDLDGKIDMVLDGGHTAFGLESTIIDATGDILRLLRPGAITIEMISEAIDVCLITLENAEPQEKPLAPGMKYKHYAPEAEVFLVDGGDDIKIADYIKSKINPADKDKAVVTTAECSVLYSDYRNIYVLGPEDRPDIMGENLFDILRSLDKNNIKTAYAHSVNEDGVGHAVMNRLAKAASGNIIELGGIKKAKRILFVCTGNTCRSPMAQAIFNSRNKKYKAFSRGIAVLSGDNLSQNAKVAIEEMGLSLDFFHPSRLSGEDIEKAFIVLCMTASHRSHVKNVFPAYRDKIFSIYEYAENLDKDVSDPYGGNLEMYRKCAEELEALIDKVCLRLN